MVLRTGGKIPIIKHVREITEMGLKEAKALTDRHCDESNKVTMTILEEFIVATGEERHRALMRRIILKEIQGMRTEFSQAMYKIEGITQSLEALWLMVSGNEGA